MLKHIVLKPHKEAFVRAGHPWIFSNAIFKSEINEVGLCQILSNDNKNLGIGMFNPRTSISVRMLSCDAEIVVYKNFFSKKFLELEEQKK